MSNLQIGLAIAGGLVLAGVVAHGAWNSRRNAPRQAKPEPAGESASVGPRDPVFSDAERDTQQKQALGDLDARDDVERRRAFRLGFRLARKRRANGARRAA